MPNVLDLFSLGNRTALITGASRGIGQALAIALAEAGADIVLIQRPGSQNFETKNEIEKLRRKAIVYEADLAKPDDMRGLVKRITNDGHDINILVNSGGIQRRHLPHEFPDEDWNEVSVSIPEGCRICHLSYGFLGTASQLERCFYSLSGRWGIHA